MNICSLNESSMSLLGKYPPENPFSSSYITYFEQPMHENTTTVKISVAVNAFVKRFIFNYQVRDAQA